MKFTTWDIETVNWTDITHIGYYNESESGVVTTIDEFLDIAERIGGYFFAHFAGGFDNRFLLDRLLDRYPADDFSISCVHNQLSCIQIKDKMTFRDSYDLLPTGLAKLAVGFGVGEKMDIDRTQMQNYSEEVVKEYVLSDCRLLYDILVKATESAYKINLTKLTFPSIAKEEWQKTISKRLWEQIQISADHDNQLRNYYFGGRCEVFSRKMGHGYYYDVNSMYPYVMQHYPYPCGQIVKTNKVVQRKIGLYKAYVYVPKCDIPPIPVRRLRDKKIVFPTGQFEAELTHIDIENLEKVGGKILKIYEGYYFTDYCYPFTDYVQKYYKIKQQSEKKSANRIISKFYLNSLYGKMAQKREFNKIIIGRPDGNLMDYDLIWTEKDYDINTDIVLDKNDKQIWMTTEASTIPYTLLHVGLMVTAYARSVLWRKMWEIIQNGNMVYYCDTDSIITDYKMDTSNELGKWGLECEIEKGIFISPKTYCIVDSFGNEIKRAKGIVSDDLHYKDYEAILNGHVHESKREGVTGFLESLHKNNKQFIERKRLIRRVSNNYDKRLLTSQTETRPFELPREMFILY